VLSAISCEGRTTLPSFDDCRADPSAPIRVEPPVVSCIELFDGPLSAFLPRVPAALA
jgi:hypothetical protein